MKKTFLLILAAMAMVMNVNANNFVDDDNPLNPGQVAIEVVAETLDAQYTSNYNVLLFTFKNQEYEFYFGVFCEGSEQDIHDGQTYTLDGMLSSYSKGVETATEDLITYSSVELVRVNGAYDINVTSTTGVIYHITYTKSETAVENISVNASANKVIENGQVIILKGEKRYNALGTEI